MSTTANRRKTPLASALLCAGLLLAAGPAAAAEYWLCAKAGSITMPDGVTVPIWGYVQDDNADLADGCPALDSTTWTAAAPVLSVPSADLTGLTVHLRNDLTAEPTSLVIPGQIAAMTPVWTDGTSGPRASTTQRVRSFTHEAAPNGGMADYTWSSIRPGTYLYHSGTHPQVQVQMGLYGALIRNFSDAVAAVPPAPAVPAQAYDGVPYGGELTLLFSEIDPAQHAAIATGTSGAPGSFGDPLLATPCPDTGGKFLPMTSTLCYKPKYFLVNGSPYPSNDAGLPALPVGQDTVVRMLNAGLRSYAPTIQGMHMKLIAEDGNRYQYRDATGFHPRDQYQYSTLLASLQTTDAVITASTPGSTVIYDRRLHLVNNLAQDGGMLVKAAACAGPCTNLSIRKSDGVAIVNRGNTVTYSIVVRNAGATAVTGATVTDTVPADLTGATWTCASTGGALCGAASGSGNINTTVDLPVNGAVTFAVSGTVSATATGNLVNTASVAAPAGVIDPYPGDNTATDTDAVILLANLSVTKTDGSPQVTAGDPVSYTIVVSNAGPEGVTGARVTDTLPAAVTGATWTCTPTGGAACPASGSGNLNATVDLPMNGSVTFTLSGTVSATATGSLVNTASAALPAGMADTNPADNSATDTDTILPPPVVLRAYFSTTGNTAVSGLAGPYDNSDIYAWYSNGTYARVFNAIASGVPATANVDAFVYNGPSDVYLSFSNASFTFPGIGTVQSSDIVHWNGTTWSMYFNGSDVGLDPATNAGENVDAFAFLPDGSLLVSTTGNPTVPGLPAGTPPPADEDLLRCVGTFGATTTCAWSMYFEGSDVGLTVANEDVDFASIASNGDIRLSVRGAFSVTSGASALTGTSTNQVFACTGPTTGTATACASFGNVLTLPTLPTGSIDAIGLP